MRYLNVDNIKEIGENWGGLIGCIEQAVDCLDRNDFSQPIKPYLRYKDPINRIIAMPAYVGGDVDTAGIKWIASFPKNIHKGIARANCAVILNNADTGVVEAVFNTSLVSAIRTASVTGVMIKYYLEAFPKDMLSVGIIGFGPIGQHHFRMCKALLGEKLKKMNLYDIAGIKPELIQGEEKLIQVCDSWQNVYQNSDIVITCTVSDAPYIDLQPKKGTLLLNISLRDYKNDVYEYVKNTIIVDNWEEICRENTDIERLNLEMGLQEDMTKTISDIVRHEAMKSYSSEDNIMFNPMGMAIFDIAICKYFYNKAVESGIGSELK